MIKQVEKLWGKEEWLVNTDLYCCKKLYFIKGWRLSLHFHINKDETFYVLKGKIKLQMGYLNDVALIHYSKFKTFSDFLLTLQENVDYYGHTFELKETNQQRIIPYTLHSIEAITDEAVVLEVSTHHDDADSYRIIPSQKL